MNYSSGRVSKIKNSDEELINKYKRFNEDNRKKRSGFDNKTRILNEENSEKHIKILKSKTLFITILIFEFCIM